MFPTLSLSSFRWEDNRIHWFISRIYLASLKRAADRDHSGWYILLTFIPLIGLIWQIELYFFAGTYGLNQYGADPRQ